MFLLGQSLVGILAIISFETHRLQRLSLDFMVLIVDVEVALLKIKVSLILTRLFVLQIHV